MTQQHETGQTPEERERANRPMTTRQVADETRPRPGDVAEARAALRAFYLSGGSLLTHRLVRRPPRVKTPRSTRPR